MENILNNLNDYILIINESGKVEFINKGLLSKLKYSYDYKVEIEKYIDIQGIILSCKNGKGIKMCLPLERSISNNIVGKVFKEKWKNREAYFIICKENDFFYVDERFKEFLDLLPFVFLIKDVEGRYLYTNEYIESVFGLKKEDILGKTDKELFDRKLLNEIQKEDEELKRVKQPRVYEKYKIRSDGSMQWFNSYKIPIVHENEVKYIAILMENWTINKRLETELSECYGELNRIESSIDRNFLGKECNDVDKILLQELGADGINIWIYDEKSRELISKYICGICKKSNSSWNNISFTKELKTIINESYDGIHNVNHIGKRKLLAEDMDIEHMGIYKIKFNNQFLGVMTIAYAKSNIPNFAYDDIIRKVCGKIGILVKNEKLSREVNKEFEKRIAIEEEMEHFLDTATDLMAIIDESGRFIKVNNGWATSLGWKKDELLNMKWQNLIMEEDLDLTNKIVEIAKFNEGKIRRVINRYKGKNGNIAWLDWGFKYLENKKILVVTARDITDKKRIEEQRKVYEKTLELENIKNEFFSNISHEFKTPLNIILATIQLIIKGIERDYIEAKEGFDLKKYSISIKQNSYRLLRLINNLIDITKIDAGYYKINLENHDIVSIVEDITISVAQYVENKGISLIFDTEVEEEVIACDPDKIERIMLNLLSNAIKYTGVNGEIRVYMKVEGYKINVSVKDNGIGIPEEKLKTVFDRFTQVDNSLTRECEGSGIGLSLVKALVEMHGGEIRAISKEGLGTEFIFTLPINLIDCDEIAVSTNTLDSRIEKCSIEFSDIYKI